MFLCEGSPEIKCNNYFYPENPYTCIESFGASIFSNIDDILSCSKIFL